MRARAYHSGILGKRQRGTGVSLAASVRVMRAPEPAGLLVTRSDLGFTLIELMVVLGILALLVAIVVPVTASLLDRSKATQTKATMKSLEQAITLFSNARPLAGAGIVRWRSTGKPPPDERVYESLSQVFGTLPPSPTRRLARPIEPRPRVIIMPPWDASPDYSGEGSEPGSDDTTAKFCMIQAVAKKGQWEHMRRDPSDPTSAAWLWVPPDPTIDAASIECLVFCLNEFCMESRSVVSQLPAKSKVNRDKDITYENTVNYDAHLPDKTEKMIDLIEIVDAWEHPLRYSVKEPAMQDPVTGASAYPATWELRSAGPDGGFALPFSPEDSSDDVVLKGT